MKKNKQLQGLRAIAIGSIVLNHCGLLRHYGQIGDVLFFCLSGFFAIKPFSSELFKVLSGKDIILYYKKKIRNILPAYWGILIVLKFITKDMFFNWPGLMKAMLFIDCPSHLWFLQQIALMYLLTPFIVLFLQGLQKAISRSEQLNDIILLFGGVLSLISIICSIFLTNQVFYLLGNGQHQPFRIWQYMMGMSFGYLYRFLKMRNMEIKSKVAGGVNAGILLLSFLFSDPIVALLKPELDEPFFLVFWSGKLDWVILVLSGLLILFLAMDDDNIVSRLLSNRILVELGNVSYETYILHVYFISICTIATTPIRGFLFIYLITVFVAMGIKRMRDIIFARRYRGYER